MDGLRERIEAIELELKTLRVQLEAEEHAKYNARNDYMDQMAEQAGKPVRDARSFMSPDFQAGAEAFLRGVAFNNMSSEGWKDGWNFAMKWIFMRNTFNLTFGVKNG